MCSTATEVVAAMAKGYAYTVEEVAKMVHCTTKQALALLEEARKKGMVERRTLLIQRMLTSRRQQRSSKVYWTRMW